MATADRAQITPFELYFRSGIVRGTRAQQIVPSTNAIAPSVSSVSPAAGQNIYPTTAISFHVTDDLGAFTRIVVAVKYQALGRTELVNDGASFTAPFSGSTRNTITNGFSYSIVPAAGWPDSPQIMIYPIDTSGNEGS